MVEQNTVAYAFEATDVSKRFGENPVLVDASLKVRKGTIHALLGGNGSGKSSFIKCLAGVYIADRGGVVVGSSTAAMRSMTPARARELGFRFVHQDLGLFEDLTIVENFALAKRFAVPALGVIRWRGLCLEVEKVLEEYGISARATDTVASLRPSQRSMVAIARAMDGATATDAILMLDEPTAALAAHDAAELMTQIRARADAGQTIVLVSHRFGEVQSVADDITVFRDGREVHTGSAAELTLDGLVQSMTGGHEGIQRHERARGGHDGRERLVIRNLRAGSVRGIDLEVRRGEVLGLAGLDGSGRSTTLRAIFGAIPSTMDATLDGRSFLPRSPRQAMARGCALVPENRLEDAAFLDLSVSWNISIASIRRWWGRIFISGRTERHQVSTLIERFAVKTPNVESPLGVLSGGNQQKAVLARWMQRDPILLLLDDPTQGVDVVSRAEIHRDVAHAADDGCAVIVASSDVDELLALSDRIVVLHEGRAVETVGQLQLTRDDLVRLTMADDPEEPAA
jgi:ribose transport system ATP-binding protein